jgi:hypothetical protein
MYPTALFEIGHKFRWKARFIVGTGYIYSLLYNGNKAKTTIRELQKVLGTKSVSGIYEFLNTIETFQKFVAEEAGIPEIEKFVKFYKGRNGGTNVEIIIPQELAYAYPNNKFFPVPKLAFLLPTSPQAKAIYIYLHYLKNKGSDTVITTASFLEKKLRIDRLSVPKYLSELQETGVLVVQPIGKGRKRKTKITLKSHKTWPENLLRSITEEYSLSHPFLKEWIIVEKSKSEIPPNITPKESGKCSDRPHKNVPIDLIKEKECSDRPHKNVPIDLIKETSNNDKLSNINTDKFVENQGVNKDSNSDFSSSENLPTTSISTTSKRITTSIYDAIYVHGGGEKFGKLIEVLKSLEKTESNNKGANPYKKPDGFKNNEKRAGELVKPNFAERLDKKELGKIRDTLKRLLPELRKAYPEVFTLENLKVFEELYAPALKRIYGDEWLPLAIMYELFNRKAPQYGYSRKVNKNFLGLLISFALKDSSSDFWEFYKKFRRVFGLRLQEVENVGEKEQQGEQPEPRLSLSDLKEFFKKKLKDKKTIYTMFIENGIKALEKVGSKWVVKCRDSIAKEYISKNFLNLLREFLKSENIQIEV